jgi:2-(1,2-epoxy-1,2-dihydrophenyl)acetyl-CoA isomerase
MPLVVAVNGIAAGGGMSLALCGDIVVAARSASFRQSFIDIGLIPDMGATAIVPGLVGRARTLGLALLGQGLPADKAADWGLIWEVVDDETLAERASDLAVALSKRPSALVRAVKAALYPEAPADLDAALANEARVQASLGRDPRFAASVEAFLSKRTKAGR